MSTTEGRSAPTFRGKRELCRDYGSSGINKRDGIVEHVRIEVDITTGKFNRIFADEAVEDRRVVTASGKIEPRGGIVFPPRVLEWIAIRRAGGGRDSERLVSVLGLDGTRGVGEGKRAP